MNYLVRKASSTTAEMSRRGLPIPNNIPSYSAIFAACLGNGFMKCKEGGCLVMGAGSEVETRIDRRGVRLFIGEDGVGKGVQSKAVSKQLEIEKDSLREEGSIGTLESRLLALEGTIATLESRLLALEGDERDFGVVSDGDIAAYSCLLKDTHLDDSDAAKDAAKDTHLDVVTTISIPMTTIEKTLKDIIHIDASDPTQETGHRHTEDEFNISKIETNNKEKPKYVKLAFGIFFGRARRNVDYLEPWMLDGLHINAFIEVMMRKRPCNAQWTLGHSELVAFYKDSSNLMSMVSVVDVVRATIDGTNPRYPSWEKISQLTETCDISRHNDAKVMVISEREE
ncbi:hypothetical protein Tco_0421305 [Tanacetum coccineum]